MENNKYSNFQNYGQLLKELHSVKLIKEYLAYMRWGDKPYCIHCKKKEFIRVYSKPGFYECSDCRIQFSVLQGTIFERSPIPLDVWLWAIFEFCTGLNSSPVSATRHTVQQKTAWKMNMRIRETLWEEFNTKLSGTIYCDETEIGADPQKDLRVFHDKRTREKFGLSPDHFMNVFGMLEEGRAQKTRPTKNKELYLVENFCLL
ncbi:MAG: IS1595 family transposase [Brumimicrobium sp.]